MIGIFWGGRLWKMWVGRASVVAGDQRGAAVGRLAAEDVGGLGLGGRWGQSARAGWLPWCWSFDGTVPAGGYSGPAGCGRCGWVGPRWSLGTVRTRWVVAVVLKPW